MNAPLASRTVNRAYVLGPDGGILRAHDLTCQSDEEAIRNAKEHASGNAVELWNRGRKIALIPLGGSPFKVF
ncbi:hypothetical protein [Microvirga yunnanensis]|uniref:hypothetical protein n=1 Tax=Microvirga yunnanensis TaxID=2953740 RepID=UPI0021C9DCEA|nr:MULTISPECIES: hypothetical protein [unclassified Microvirga]